MKGNPRRPLPCAELSFKFHGDKSHRRREVCRPKRLLDPSGFLHQQKLPLFLIYQQEGHEPGQRDAGTPGGQVREGDRTAQGTLTLSSSADRPLGGCDWLGGVLSVRGRLRSCAVTPGSCISGPRGQDLASWGEAGRFREPPASGGLGQGTTYSFGLVLPIKSQSMCP